MQKYDPEKTKLNGEYDDSKQGRCNTMTNPLEKVVIYINYVVTLGTVAYLITSWHTEKNPPSMSKR
jgi:hypothetical protein